MDELTALRALVDDANLVLRDVLQLRARLVSRIAAVKAARGLSAVDPAREAAMLDAIVADAPPGLDEDELRAVFEAILTVSRARVARGA